jgi:hypothetical protein
MTRLHARSNAEAHLYMDLRPCACGAVEFDRQSNVISDGDALCSRYAGPCRRCGTPRVFVFELPETIRPVRGDQIEFGGSDPSRLLDPGEWLAVADDHARGLHVDSAGTHRDLDLARAAVEEVLKFVPAGADRVPIDAFRTDRGRAVRNAEPGRFRRARLEAVLGAYSDLLAKSPATPSARPVEPPPGETPAPGTSLAATSVPALIDALARAVATQHGFEGAELRRQVSDFTGQVQTLVRRFEIKASEDQQRRRTSAEIERLLDGIARSGTPAGAEIAAHKDAIVDAFRQVDLGRIAGGLQVLVAWLRNPSDANAAPVQDMIAKLHAMLGASPAGSDDDSAAAPSGPP